MRKLIAIVLVLAVMFALAACSGGASGDTVTIYIPEKMEAYQADGTLYATITYNYEDGWRNKDSFKVEMLSTVSEMGSAAVTYTAEKTIQDVGNGAKLEVYYNNAGVTTKSVNIYADGRKQETVYTLDSLGRVVKEELKLYESADANPTVTTRNYTYTDTDTGSTCTYTEDSITYIKNFDKNGRQIAQILQASGSEMSRTEITYDSVGNPISQTSYVGSQKSTEMRFIYKTVKVSAEFVARFPQFKQAK